MGKPNAPLAPFAIAGEPRLSGRCSISLGALAGGARIITRSNPGYALELLRQHWLGTFPAMLLDLGAALHKTRHELVAATATGASRLETALRELSKT